MKLWLVMAFALFFFSGCSLRTENVKLQNINAEQSLLIQKQKNKISALEKKLKKRQVRKRKVRKVRKVPKVPKKVNTIPIAPKKHIKLKKVEDSNYSSGYMYPDTKKKKKTAPNVASKRKKSTISMGKPECITMIGQTKFDKYTKMFGSESASIKRCNMLKAMR